MANKLQYKFDREHFEDYNLRKRPTQSSGKHEKSDETFWKTRLKTLKNYLTNLKKYDYYNGNIIFFLYIFYDLS